MGENFLRVLVDLDSDFFNSIMFELRFVNPFKMPVDASLSQIMGNMIVSLFFSLPISMAMRSLLS